MHTSHSPSFENRSNHSQDDLMMTSATKRIQQSPTNEQMGYLPTTQSSYTPDTNTRVDPALPPYSGATYPTTASYDPLARSPQGPSELTPRETGKLNLDAIASRTDELLKNVESALQRSQMLSSKIREKSLTTSQAKVPSMTAVSTSGVYAPTTTTYTPSYDYLVRPAGATEVPKSSYELLNRKPEQTSISGTVPSYDIPRVQIDAGNPYAYPGTTDIPRNYSAGYTIPPNDTSNNDILRERPPLYHQRSPLLEGHVPLDYERTELNNLRTNVDTLEMRVGTSITTSSPRVVSSYRAGSPIVNRSPMSQKVETPVYTTTTTVPVQYTSFNPNTTTTTYYVQRQSPYRREVPIDAYPQPPVYNNERVRDYREPEREDVNKKVNNVVDEVMQKYFNNRIPTAPMTTSSNLPSTSPYRPTPYQVEQPISNPSYNTNGLRNGAPYHSERTRQDSPTNYQSFQDSREPTISVDKRYYSDQMPDFVETYNDTRDRYEQHYSDEERYEEYDDQSAREHDFEVPEVSPSQELSDRKMKRLTFKNKPDEYGHLEGCPHSQKTHAGDLQSDNESPVKKPNKLDVHGHLEGCPHSFKTHAGDLQSDNESPVKKQDFEGNAQPLESNAGELESDVESPFKKPLSTKLQTKTNAGDLQSDTESPIKKTGQDFPDTASVFDFDQEGTRFEETPQKPAPGKPPRKTVQAPPLRRDPEALENSKVAVWVIPKADGGKEDNMLKSSKKLAESLKSTGKVPLITYCFDKSPNMRLNSEKQIQ